MISIDEIRERLPHRYPFLMIDRVLELEEGVRVVALKNVTVNEPFFQGHYPQVPVMPGVMQVEAMAQAGGLAAGGAREGVIPLLAAVDKVKFRKVVRPGDQLLITAQILRARRQVVKVSAKGEVEGEKVTEGELTFMLAEEGAVNRDATT